MNYTKERVADAAASARPYVERALRDKELRDNVRNAYTSGRAVYDQLASRRKVSDAASQLAGDKDIQGELRNALGELRNAAGRVQAVKRQSPERARAARNGLLLLVGIALGLLLNPITGPADLAASLGVPVLTIGPGTSDYALAQVIVAARAFGLQAVDGPHARLGDDLGLVVSARRALEHGYDGKWVIHPSQIEPVNLVFTPSPAELERAKRILDAAAGAARFEGELVDEASRRLAEALLRRAEALS